MLAGDSVDEIHQIVDTLYAIGNPSQKTLDAVKITQERLDDPYVAKIYEKLRLLMVSSRKEEEVEPAAAAKQPVAASAGAASAGRQIVAVFNVHDASGKTDEQVLDQLTAYLTTAMAASGRFKVIPQNQIKARLMEQKSESYSECVDKSCQIALGRSLAAQKSLATQLLKVGKDCAVTANLYDLKTETTEKGAMVKTKCGQDELLDAIGQVVEQLSAD